MYKSNPSAVRRRLDAVAAIPSRPGAGMASVFYLAVEGLAFLAIVAMWLLWWAAMPADASPYIAVASMGFAKGSIVLGMMLLGIAYLMVRAVQPQKPECPHEKPHGDVPHIGGDL
jgi:hypothetical protein